EQEGNFEALHGRCRACEERLDRLDRGHETARALLNSAQHEAAGLGKTLEQLTAANLPAEPYARELATVADLTAQAGGLIEADPIGAEGVVAHSREILGAVLKRVEAVLARLADSRSALAAIDEVAGRAADLRSKGLKL